MSPPLWFGLVGFYYVPLHAKYFHAFFILFRLLCLGWPFCMLEVCGSSSLWMFLPVGGVEWVACQDFLAREAWVSVLGCGADLFSLECNEVSIVSLEVSVGLVWLLAACIFVLRVMFLHFWRISLLCLALTLVGSWVELGFSVGMEGFGWALVY